MTNYEKRQKVLRIVEEHGDLPNSFIARQAEVTEGLVRKMLKEFGGKWPSVVQKEAALKEFEAHLKKHFEDEMVRRGLTQGSLCVMTDVDIENMVNENFGELDEKH